MNSASRFHGTDSRSAQLIAISQRFNPSKQGLLGTGVYLTRTRQKAEGYRVHHPGALAVGGALNNFPLPSGARDPGCILKVRVRLGACKTLSRDAPMADFKIWHSQAVPQLALTSSIKAAVAAQSKADIICYNSAFSAGCSCCPEHGDDCPGAPAQGHRPPDGMKPCQGRCRAGLVRFLQLYPTVIFLVDSYARCLFACVCPASVTARRPIRHLKSFASTTQTASTRSRSLQDHKSWDSMQKAVSAETFGRWSQRLGSKPARRNKLSSWSWMRGVGGTWLGGAGGT